MAEKTTHSKKAAAKTKKKPAAKKKKPTYSRKTPAQKKKNTGLNKKYIVMLIISLLVIIGIVIAAVISANSSPRHSNPIHEISKETAWGIDVSSHNGKINWKKVSKKADFAFIRAGYRGYSKGEINADNKMKANLEGANKYGIPVGVYFYSQAVSEKEAEKEAEFVLKKINGYNVTLPVVIDFEYAYSKGEPAGRLHSA